jgi:hypothetical protein
LADTALPFFLWDTLTAPESESSSNSRETWTVRWEAELLGMRDMGAFLAGFFAAEIRKELFLADRDDFLDCKIKMRDRKKIITPLFGHWVTVQWNL